MNTFNEQAQETLSYTVKTASKATGIPESTIWMHIKSGALASKKVGRHRLIPAPALKNFVGAD